MNMGRMMGIDLIWGYWDDSIFMIDKRYDKLVFQTICLVGGIPTPLKNMKVSSDDDIPNLQKNDIHVPNHQPVLEDLEQLAEVKHD